MHEVWYLSHLTVPSLSLFFLFKILWAVRQAHCRNERFFFPGLSLKLSKGCSALLQDKKVLHSLLHVLQLRISVAATSIPLMLYSWHDRRHEIVGQMVDYTNPHYSSWWGWNLDHMNLVLHFFSCYVEMSSHYRPVYNPYFQSSVSLKNPLFRALATHFLSFFLNY